MLRRWGKSLCSTGMADIAREFAALTGATGLQSAGRAGARRGKVSERTAILQIALVHEAGEERVRLVVRPSPNQVRKSSNAASHLTLADDHP